ncbi:MAG: 4-hydroxy-tetrahydrodipicolinate synthase [Lachnospiraceae bacterium]|nr:4-hydroxy-tetrahydrodipicolinate synthase [Lachnospiraceae bacterium]
MAIFEGAGVAIITPMNPDGSINYGKFDRIIDDQIANGTDCIVVCGTTGESSTMTHEEHIETIRYVASYVNGRVPVIAGSGSNCTETAIHLSKEAEKAGVQGVLLVSPYYNKATQKGLIEHFTRTAAAINIPVVLYNIPGRTGVNILPETICKLVTDVDNIVAVKDATGNLGQTAHLAALCGDKVDIYSGDDNLTLPILSLGGKGVISVLSHVAPRDTHDLVASYLAGDTKRAKEIQLKYIKLIDLLFSEVNPIPVKAAMNMLGYEVGGLRLPLTTMEKEHEDALRAELMRLGILSA